MSSQTQDSLANTTPPLSDAQLKDVLGFIEIDGLAKANDGQSITLRVPRELPDPHSDFVTIPGDSATEPAAATYSMRARPKPWLASSVTLKLRLGQKIAETYRSYVYEVETIGSGTPGLDLALPPLVIKIAQQTTGRRLSVEGDVYDQLGSIQGTVIARCYGYFRRFVNLQELSVVPWDPDCVFPRTADTFDIYNMPHTCATLNILLLERLGKPIHEKVEGEPRVQKKILRKQLKDMYRAAANLGFSHGDIRTANILRAAPEGLHGPSQPYAGTEPPTGASGEVYPWRLVDWEDSQKWPTVLRRTVYKGIDREINAIIDDGLPMIEEEEQK